VRSPGCERETGLRWVKVARGGGSRFAISRSAMVGGFVRERDRLEVRGFVRGEAGLGWLEEQKKRAEREKRVREHRREIFGKWFTENFSVNRFPNFSEEFSGQLTNDFR
jgi:hypothetical protein